MKFIRDGYQLSKNDWKNRVIFMAENDQKALLLESNEVETNDIDTILNGTLLSFSVVKLEQLNKQAGDFTESQKAKYRDIIGYYLTLTLDDPKVMPPRILARLEGGKLWKFLSAEMHTQVRYVMQEKRENLRELLKDKKARSWTPAEASRVCTLYKFLLAHGIEDSKLDPLFEETQKKLLKRAIPLVHRFEQTEITSGQIDQAIDGGQKQESLTSTDKLLLLEVHRLFPHDEKWGWQEHSNQWKDLTDSVSRELLSQKKLQNNPNLALAWELLDEFVENQELGIDLFADQSQKDKIKALIKRGNSAQFLKFAKAQQVLLPLHLKALDEIVKDEEGFLLDTEGKQEDYSSEDVGNAEAIELLQQKTTELGEEKKKFEDSVFEKILQGQATDDLKEKYQTAKDGVAELSSDIDEEAKLKVYEELREAQSVILDKFPPSKEDRQKTSEFKQRIAGNRDEEMKLMNENKDSQEWNNYFINAQEIAEETTQNFWRGLEQRISSHELRSADLSVLWEGEDSEQAGFDAGLKTPPQLTRFRTAFEEILSEEKFSEVRTKLKSATQKIDEKVKEETEQWKNRGSKKEEEKKLFLNQKDDKFSEWFRIWDEEFGYGKLSEELRAKGFDLQAEFDSDQIRTEAVLGALQYSRDRVISELEESLDNDYKEDFFAEWQRRHHKVDSSKDLSEFRTDIKQAKEALKDSGIKLEESKQKTTAFAQNIFAQNLREILAENNIEDVETKISDILLLQGTRSVAMEDETEQDISSRDGLKQKLKNILGENVSEELLERVLLEQIKTPLEDNYMRGSYQDSLFIPGKELLKDAQIQTRETKEAILKTMQPLKNKIDKIQKSFLMQGKKEDETTNDNEKDLKSLFQNWKVSERSLRAYISEIKSTCQEIFPASFVETFFAAVEEIFKELSSHLTNFEDLAKQNKFKFSGKEKYFDLIFDCFKTIELQLDFEKGQWAEESKKLDGKLETTTNGIQEIDKLKFFTDQSADKKDFKKEYKELRDGFIHKFSLYRQNFGVVKRILEHDIQKLNDEDFQQKFGMSKEYGQKVLQEYNDQNTNFDELWNKYGANDFIDEWVKKYNKDAESRVEALQEFGALEDITKAVSNSEQDLAGLKRWLEDYKKLDSSGSRINWSPFSIYDIYRVVVESFEKHTQNWKRDSDRAVAQIGSSALGTGNTFLGRIGQRWKQMAQESENQRVQEYETQYNTEDGWDIQKVLYRTSNRDEARACINLLSQKGFLRWDDPELWKTLNRLMGRKNYFHVPEDMSKTSEQILGKMKSACEIIWTGDYFRSWDGELEGNLKKAREGFSHEFLLYENDGKARTNILSDMLKRWNRGETEGIDPARFEAFLFQAFKDGKLNGIEDQRWYFLIMAVATKNPRTGQALLSRDVLMRINNEFLPRFPHVEFFTDKECFKYKGEIVPKDFPGAKERAWEYDDYLEWADMLNDVNGTFNPKESNITSFFLKVVDMSPMAQDRASRMQRFSEGEGDHDDAWAPFLDWTQVQAIRQLATKSEGTEKNSPDWWRTFLDTFPTYMARMNEYIQEGDDKWSNISGWNDPTTGMKQQALKKVGSRLKVAISVVQSLLGNYVDANSSGRSTIFGAEEWDKQKTGYSPSLDKSKDKINDFMRTVFHIAGDQEAEQKYEEILNYKGYERGTFANDVEKHEEANKNDPEIRKHKAKKALSRELLMDSQKNRAFFEDTSVIERALSQYYVGLDKKYKS